MKARALIAGARVVGLYETAVSDTLGALTGIINHG
jgi:hypothetical protein